MHIPLELGTSGCVRASPDLLKLSGICIPDGMSGGWGTPLALEQHPDPWAAPFLHPRLSLDTG